MGRNLDVTGLTKSEQDIIVQVIRRDLALRKNEDKRIDVLHKHLPKKEQVNNSSEQCVICGTSFLWLFNPKAKCKICGNFFCKSKISCGRNDAGNQGHLCNFCYQEREVRMRSLGWFYSHLKTKFRRHGGAKVLREFYKRSERGLHQDASMDVPSIRREIERTITSSLVSKVEEIKSLLDETHAESENEQAAEDALEQFFKNDQSHHQKEDELLWRYLKDHKQYLKMRILKKASMLQKDGRSSSFSVRDAETMTEASESELESLPSCSGSLRSRASLNNLPGLVRSLNSTGSLQSSLLQESSDAAARSKSASSLYYNRIKKRDAPVNLLLRYTIVQGVIKPKETVASSNLNAAMMEAFGNPDVDSNTENDTSFNTEMKFTAVNQAASLVNQTAKRRSSHSSTSEMEDLDDNSNDNWVISQPKVAANLLTKKHTYLPQEGAQSAYEYINSTENDAEMITDQAVEEVILPMNIKRDFSDVSARSLSCNVVEIAASNPPPKQSWSLDRPEVDDIMQSLSCEVKTGAKNEISKTSQSPEQVQEEEIIATQRTKQEINDEVAKVFQEAERKATEKLRTSVQRKSAEVPQTIFPKRMTAASSSNRIEGNAKPKNDVVKHFSVCLEGERDREDDLDKHFTKAYEKITIHDLAASSASSSDENLASKQLQSNSVLSSIDSTSGDSAKPSRDGKSQTSSENAVIYLNKHIENKAVRDDSSSTHEQIDDSDENLQNNEEIFEIKNAEIHSDNSSASSPSSISDQSDAEESDVMLRNQVKDDVILDDVQANSSTQNEPELGPKKSIDDIVRDLQTAGLTAKKTKFNRSSLSSSKLDNKIKPSYQSESMKKDYKNTPVNARVSDVDLEVYSFKVDPANYKKHSKLVREVSLQSLILSDNESILSDASTRSSKPDANATDADVTSMLASVASRRSLFDKTSTDISARKAYTPEHTNSNKSVSLRESSPLHAPSKSRFALPNVVIIETSAKELMIPFEEPRHVQKEASSTHEKPLDTTDKNYVISENASQPTVNAIETSQSSTTPHLKSNEQNCSNEKIFLLKKSNSAALMKRFSTTHQQAIEESLTFNRGSPFRGSLTMRGSWAGYLHDNKDKNKVTLGASVPEESEKN